MKYAGVRTLGLVAAMILLVTVVEGAAQSEWIDEFDGSMDSDWSWLSSDSTASSLSANPGYLRIQTQRAGGQPPNGAVVLNAPSEEFVIEAKVLFTPFENFQQAGLIIYEDLDNVLILSRAYCDFVAYGCVENGIYYDSTQSTESHRASTIVKDTAWLRLTKTGSQVLAEYSEDGNLWQVVGTHTLSSSESVKIGLISNGDRESAGRISADFDYFKVRWDETSAAAEPDEDTEVASSPSSSATRIVNVAWLPGDGFIKVLLDPFPAWGGWTMYLDGEDVPMEGDPGAIIVRPNDEPRNATGVYIGTDPWVTSLREVEFPCKGTLQFDIPGEGLTNCYEFSLREDGCCTAIDCESPELAKEEMPPKEEIVVAMDPPIAERITVTPIGVEGYAEVSGAPGAVYPDSTVWVQNLNAYSVTVVEADADGAFRAELFCPPGTSLMVKHDPNGEHIRGLWNEVQRGRSPGDLAEITTLWGTIIPVTHRDAAEGFGQAFSTAGAVREGPLWAGFWVEGRLELYSFSPGDGLRATPGDAGRIQGTIHFVSDGLDSVDLNALQVMLHFDLRRLFGSDGFAEPWGIWFDGQLFTPTGLPIEFETSGNRYGIGGVSTEAFRRVSERCVAADFSLRFSVPRGIEAGIYRPEAWVQAGGVPLATGENPVDVWYHHDPTILLPAFTVGNAAEPHIPWTLFGDALMNGYRGVTAREDIGRFEMINRVVYPTNRSILSPIDLLTGEEASYRFDLGSHWISASERRTPCPPHIPLAYPSGRLSISIEKPDGTIEAIGPSPLAQSVVHTPTTLDGGQTANGTGQVSDLYHASMMGSATSVAFDQYGDHVITLSGSIEDVHGNSYPIRGTYDLLVARILDLDPAQLPTMPYEVGDSFAPGLHVFPAVPADVEIRVTHLPDSDPERAIVHAIDGKANRFGIFAGGPNDAFRFDEPGEFRVDIAARYEAEDGTIWAGTMTWGNVVASKRPSIEAHGRRGMDYHGNRIDDMPAWFEVFDLPREKVGIEVYYPYFSGDIHWGNEDNAPGDSIHPIITFRDLTSDQRYYDILLDHWDANRSGLRWPPEECWDESGTWCLEERFAMGEAPLFSTTTDRSDPITYPEKIDLLAYWYASSERPDVHVRQVISDDNMGTGYWRFDDTYGMQLGESAKGDLEGDLKWEFGGAVFRVPDDEIAEYAIYSSLWVLLPDNDPIGARITPPFQDATGASINGGPILTLLGEEIDMLFLPKGVRPGDVLETGEAVSFSGHVGPPLDSRVEVFITSPSGGTRTKTFRANRIGWIHDPSFDFAADETGCWTVSVQVIHDRPYVGNGVIPMSHNTGTVLGTTGEYCFYVVPADAPALTITAPSAGRLPWPSGLDRRDGRIEPIEIEGQAPAGTERIYVTVHDKGVVMVQDELTPASDGTFSYTYDAMALHDRFPFLSLTAHEGRWEGLADEVAISFLAVGGEQSQAAVVVLIGEEVFLADQ